MTHVAKYDNNNNCTTAFQLVFVSVGSSRPARKIDGSLPSASLPSPPVDRLPMMLLNQEPYFGQLLTMLEKLSKLDLMALNIVSTQGQKNVIWVFKVKLFLHLALAKTSGEYCM